MTLVLEGIKVIDASQVAAVPMAARILADFGADVIHIENTLIGDMFRHVLEGMKTGIKSETNYIWENYNRNKRSMTLDLTQEGGREVMHRMLETADVFMTNFRPYELIKFNLEYEALKGLNPRLICTYLNGYGKEGADKNLPAYDHTAYWARSGIPHRIRSLTKALQAPGVVLPAFLPSFGDHVAALAMVSGIMMALYEREKTGKGQEVSASLFQTGVYQQSFDIAGSLTEGKDCVAIDPENEVLNPLYGQYETKDGRWILLSVLAPERYIVQFCEAIKREDLLQDERFATIEVLEENHMAMKKILKDVFHTKTLEEWKPLLDKAGIPYSPVQTHLEVIRDPQARENNFYVSYDHPEYGNIEGVRGPVNLGSNRDTVRMPAPEFGQHTEEVLLEHGFSWDDIADFQKKGIIA